MKDSKKQVATINVRAEVGTVLSLKQLIDMEANGNNMLVLDGKHEIIGRVITGYGTCLPSAYPTDATSREEFRLFCIDDTDTDDLPILYFVHSSNDFGVAPCVDLLKRQSLLKELRSMVMHEDNFVTRLINEIKELDSNMRKLEEFINNEALFSKVSKAQQHLLPKQYEYMHYMLDILIKRFDDLSNDTKYADIFANSCG